MASKRVRLGYWKLDAKQFSFWFSVAFIAGAGPNLAGAVHWGFLLGLALFFGVVAFLMWKSDERKTGIGVYVHLPRPEDGEVPPSLIKFVHRWMKKDHRDWFRSGPDLKSHSIRERVDWTVSTIQHRLDEAELRAGEEPPLFIYLHCRLEEAFTLGAKVGEIWKREKNYPLLSGDEHDAGRFTLGFRVRSLSTYDRPSGEIFELDLSKISGSQGMERSSVQVEIEDALQVKFGSGVNLDSSCLAVVIHAATESAGNFQSFKKGALQAASGASTNGYSMHAGDICDKAIVFSMTADALVSGLRDRNAEKFVQEINRSWRDLSARLYGKSNVPVRVFMKGPSILAFAVGSLLPKGSRLVAWDAALAAASEAEFRGDALDIVAIIDGDDVGTEMERNLLRSDLDEATTYSARVQSTLQTAFDALSGIPGVALTSVGGDSALFQLPEAVAPAFEENLERLRNRLNFRMSCGMGRNSRDAYLALRVAKTSGKNKTERIMEST